jgi:hypothetical protein
MVTFPGERIDFGSGSPAEIREQLWLIVSIVLMLGFISIMARLSEAQDMRAILERMDPKQVDFMKEAVKESLLRSMAETLRNVEDANSISRFSDFSDTRDTSDPDHPCQRVYVHNGLPADKEAAKMFTFAHKYLEDERAFANFSEKLLQDAIEKVPALQQAAIRLDPTMGTNDPQQSVLLQARNMIRDRRVTWSSSIAKTQYNLLTRAVSLAVREDPIESKHILAQKFADDGYPLLREVTD